MAQTDHDGGGRTGTATGSATAHSGGYLEELHVALVVALVVICIALGLVGWKLHPHSNGFQPVPQDVRILVAGSGFSGIESLTQSGDDGATLKVSTGHGKGYVPLRDSDAFTMLAGPQAAGAAGVVRGSGVTLDGKPLPSRSWAYIVLNARNAQPCGKNAGYRVGTVALPLGSPTSALVVPPARPFASVGNTVPPPGLCIHWDTDSPFSLSGPYLSVRFPPLRGVSSAIPYTQIPQTGDLGAGSINRVFYLDGGNTANFAIQTDPHPTVSAPLSWTWTIKDSPQVIQVAATNSSDVQRENNDAFYSGVLFGVVGGALISLITELVVPLRRRRRS
jgi:hypothetical protein